VYALAALQYQLQQARTLYAPLSKMLGLRLISDYKVHLASVPGELYQIEQREYRVLPASSPENRVYFDVDRCGVNWPVPPSTGRPKSQPFMLKAFKPDATRV
jgi:hypothetical protein